MDLNCTDHETRVELDVLRVAVKYTSTLHRMV